MQSLLQPMLLIAVATAAFAAATDQPPYAGDDYYPSPERPVGFRGDGSGYFPGARVVSEWWEGTPVQREQAYQDKRGGNKTDKAWFFDDDQSRNIVWKATLPSWSNGHPIVVGDRVFTVGEPDYLFCHDARSGELLWARRCNPWSAAGVDAQLAGRLQTLHEIYEEGYPMINKMTSGGTTSNQVDPKVFRELLDIFINEHWPSMKASLDELAPGPDWQQLLEQDLADLEGYFQKYDSKKRPKVKSELRKRIGKAIDKLSPVAVPIDAPWGHMVGWCAAPPVSDGERVYASFGQGGILCCDLDGEVLWTAFSQPSETGGTTTQSLQGPLLCDDVLIDARGKGTIRGFDTATGRQLWEAPVKHPDGQTGRKGGYYVGNHAIVPLTTNGDRFPVLVTTMCHIIRPSDGRSLGFLPWPHDYGPSGGPSVMWSGDKVYRAANGDGGGCPFTGYQLAVVSNEQVTAEIICTLGEKGSPGYEGQVCTPDFLLLAHDDFSFVSPDGSETKSFRKFGGFSNVLAGTHFLWHESGARNRFMSSWGHRRFDGQVFMDFSMQQVSDPRNPQGVGGKRVLGGENWPHVPAMERLVPKLYDHPAYWGQCYGKPAHFIHTDTALFPMANRLFVKTVGHLYCIGDPDETYSWNPASRKPR